MKKQFLAIVLIGGLAGATGCAVEGGYVVTRPAEVVYTRPIAPGPDYIWVDGDWVWTSNRYVWREGHWGRPRGGRTWQGGHWVQGSGRGWRWERGHWR